MTARQLEVSTTLLPHQVTHLAPSLRIPDAPTGSTGPELNRRIMQAQGGGWSMEHGAFESQGEVEAWLGQAAEMAGRDLLSEDMAKFLGLSCQQSCLERLGLTELPQISTTTSYAETTSAIRLVTLIMPAKTKQYVNEELDRWAKLGVRGHFEGEGRHWAKIDDLLQSPMACVVGAKDQEIAVMNGLTANIHLMFVPFYRPTQERYKIATSLSLRFSRAHVCGAAEAPLDAKVRFHGFDPHDAMVLVSPRQGEQTLRTSDILDVIQREGPQACLVFFPGVQYYTGQLFDMKAITAKGHEQVAGRPADRATLTALQGCVVGFDLAHAVGNVELHLHDWEVDFACCSCKHTTRTGNLKLSCATRCTYKYLNAGPGSIAGTFVHEKHGSDSTLPRFAGWWGHDDSTRFDMTKPFKAEVGARGFQLSNPPILQCGMKALRSKSEIMTGYLLMLFKRRLAGNSCLLSGLCANRSRWQFVRSGHVTSVTPENPQERGCQLSIIFDKYRQSYA
eukprot:747627-Hanusia_phi.AAC.7